MKTPPKTKTPPNTLRHRPRYYDVTQTPRVENSPPPGKPSGPSFGTILKAALARAVQPLVLGMTVVWLWMRKPIVLIAVAIVGGTLMVRAIERHFQPPIIDGPALTAVGWRASSYPSLGSPGAAVDGDLQSRWTTRGGQNASDWFAVDMRRLRKFHQVVMDAGTYGNDYPRSYAVYVSNDGSHWGSPVARGEGTEPVTIVDLGQQSARYVKVVQTSQDQNPWSLCEFTVR